MDQKRKPDLPLDIRINCLFKDSLLFCLIVSIFILAPAFLGEASDGRSLSDLAFSIATVDKRTDPPVQWVAAGGVVLAYGAGQQVDFALVDDPFSPISHLTLDGVISEALVLGKYALLSQKGLGLRMVDLSAPSNPLDLGFYPLSGTTFHLTTWGNLLFVAGADPGIHIFDLFFSNEQNPPLNLIPREVISVTDPITALAAWEWRIYAATGNEIKVYDVSDPSLTLEIGRLPISLPARSMAINGDKLFVAAGTEGLHVVDLSVPGNTEALATHPVQSESLYLAGRLVYLATGNEGLHLLHAGPIAATTFSVGVGLNGNLFFSPSTVNINPGDTINWVWGSNFHSTTSGMNCTPNGVWNSGELDTGSTFQFTFNTAGSFPYFSSVGSDCPSGMTGTVNVGPAATVNIFVTPASVNFGNVNAGSTSDHVVTITNQADSTASLTGSVGTLAVPFSVVSGGGAFSLAPGQSLTVTVRFSPTAAGPASTSLSIIHNATNQTNPTPVPLNGTGVTTPLPDLVVSSISGPTTSKPGGRIAITNTVTNQGTLAAGNFVVNFYLSTDQQITTGDIFLGKRSVRGLAAGTSSGPVSTNVTIPRTVTTGSYFIGAIVDPTDVIQELDEGNNAASDPAGINVCLSLSKPRLVSPKNRGKNIPTAPTLDWSDVNGASTYEVQVSTDSGFGNIVATQTGLTNSQWTVAPVLNGTTSYFWRARATNLCGPGPYSATSSFTTQP